MEATGLAPWSVTEPIMSITVVYPHLRVEAFRSTPNRFEFDKGLYVPHTSVEAIVKPPRKVEMRGMDSCRIDVDLSDRLGPWGSRLFAPISVFNNHITRFRVVGGRRSVGM